MNKVVTGNSTLIMNAIFELRDGGRFNLRHQNTFQIPIVFSDDIV